MLGNCTPFLCVQFCNLFWEIEEKPRFPCGLRLNKSQILPILKKKRRTAFYYYFSTMDSGKLDQSLWNDIRAGSERAFSTLFFRYSELLLNYGSMIVKEKEDSKLYWWIVSQRRRPQKDETKKGKFNRHGLKPLKVRAEHRKSQSCKTCKEK